MLGGILGLSQLFKGDFKDNLTACGAFECIVCEIGIEAQLHRLRLRTSVSCFMKTLSILPLEFYPLVIDNTI